MQKQIITYAVILAITAGCCLCLVRTFGVRLAAASVAAVLAAVAAITLILDRLL